MSFGTLALISAIAVLGPLLALPDRWHLPVLLGELLAGVLLGHTGVGVLDPQDVSFELLANIGFALVMFVAGTHVPVRDPRLPAALRTGGLRVLAVGALAVPIAIAVAHLFGTGHAALYAVLLASSSAAIVLPIVDALRLDGAPVVALLPQVAIADTLCIVALPLVIDARHAARAALGAAAVIACTAALFVALRYLERAGIRKRIHRLSERRKFALELRFNLVILFALAALAVATHVSILLAGFGFGLAVAAVGEPRRLARQLFALTEGFLGPLFFVWLGASLDVREFGHRSSFIGLGVVLGGCAVLVHAAMRFTGQPLSMSGLAAAQLGVPVAAATIGAQSHVLAAGEPAALILGALVTIGVAVAAGGRAVREGLTRPIDRPAAADLPE
ncbi:MAG TPA: cation:proton antiporter [Micromonosporaceae bacterium]|nr:cation:proton antiporter [Micromonosporaceae bacterium]